MKTFSRKNSVAAVVLAAATIGLPATALAGPATSSDYRYEKCKRQDTENQIIGGVVGAIAGGAAGSELASNGTRNEGAAIGALLGAAAGVAIADKDCKEEAGYRHSYSGNTSYYPYNSNSGTVYRTHGSHSGHNTYYGSRNSSPYYGSRSSSPYYGSRSSSPYYRSGTYSSGHRGYHPVTRTPGRAYGNPHTSRQWGFNPNSHVCHENETRRQHIEWQIKELRREREYLKDRRKYYRYDQNIERRIWEIGQELEQLKYELKYVKDDYRYRDRYYYKTRH